MAAYQDVPEMEHLATICCQKYDVTDVSYQLLSAFYWGGGSRILNMNPVWDIDVDDIEFPALSRILNNSKARGSFLVCLLGRKLTPSVKLLRKIGLKRF